MCVQIVRNKDDDDWLSTTYFRYTTYFMYKTVNYFYNGLMFVINKYKYRKIHSNQLMLTMIFS